MLRKSLKGYITAQEIGENQFLTNSEDDENPKAHEHKVRQFKKPFGTMSSLMSTERYKNTTPNCFYCEQPHWSDECHNFSTLQERKEKAKGRCYICLHPGHVMAKCKVGKSGYHCKEKESHHRSLCPKFLKRKKPPSNSVFRANTAPPLVEDCNEGQSMLAAGEQVILQTVIIEAMDPGQSKSEITRVLMDTGSQRTYITEEIVKNLKLTTEGNVKLTVFTFGASKPKEITTPIITVLLKSKKGNTVSIKASVVPEISGNVQRAPIKIDNQFKIIRKYELADTFPKHTESSSIGILIGNDCYNDIMSTERIKIYEGLYVIRSKFGWMINGQTKTKDGSKDKNLMLIMTHSTNNILPEIHQFTPVEPSLQPEPNIDEFWKLETIGIILPEKTKNDDGVMEHFNNTIIQENGRCQVVWPWRNEDINFTRKL